MDERRATYRAAIDGEVHPWVRAMYAQMRSRVEWRIESGAAGRLSRMRRDTDLAADSMYRTARDLPRDTLLHAGSRSIEAAR